MPEDKQRFFHAVLKYSAFLKLTELDNDLPSIVIDTGESRLQVKASKQLRAHLLHKTPAATQRLPLILYPRTDQEGRLLQLTRLQLIHTPESDKSYEEGLSALGELVFIDTEHALIGLKIWPNVHGFLAEPFILNLMISLDMLDSLPAIGSAVKIKGSLKSRSLRMAVTKVEIVPLPPMRKLKKPQGKQGTSQLKQGQKLKRNQPKQ